MIATPVRLITRSARTSGTRLRASSIMSLSDLPEEILWVVAEFCVASQAAEDEFNFIAHVDGQYGLV
jgi:hypothetical protein